MDKTTCRTCKHWQGHKYSDLSDCYRVIGELEPRLFRFTSDLGFKFNTPFDPADVQYYEYSWLEEDDKHQMFTELYKATLNKVKHPLVLDDKKYIRTPKDYYCKSYERRI